MTRATRVGITGKIASGKSTVSELMRQSGIEVIDTDTLAKDLMQESPHVKAGIVSVLGPQAYPSGTLDRAFVATQIFGNDSTRRAVEAVVHPAVSEELERRFRAGAPGSIIAGESALILQSELQSMFDYIVLVDSSDDQAIGRLKNNGKISEEDARTRLKDQGYDRVRRDAVDITIQNTGSLDELRHRAIAVIQLLKALAMRDLPEMPLHAIDDEEYEDDSEFSAESVDDAPN